MTNTPLPNSNMPEKDPTLTVSLASLGPDAKMLKVGDTVEMKINSITGDSVELAPNVDDAEDENMDPKTMPLDKLEASLPTAERD